MKTLPIVAAALLAFAASTATADDNDKIRARLTGYQEVPAVSTQATGSFVATVSADRQSFHYELSYSGLQGDVQQAHIHFAQRNVNGTIVIWLCGTGTAQPLAGPPGTQTCPQSGTISGTVGPANVGGAATQQILTGEFDEALAVIRAGLAYVNVHTTKSPGGEIRGQLRGHGMRKEDERDGAGDGDHKH
jgi:CHRD domain